MLKKFYFFIFLKQNINKQKKAQNRSGFKQLCILLLFYWYIYIKFVSQYIKITKHYTSLPLM